MPFKDKDSWGPYTDRLAKAFIVILLLVMAVMFAASFSHAAACLTIDVEPRYLTHQMDGDTISVFTLPQGKVKFRVQGIDTPERDEPGWAEARAFTWEWLQRGPFQVSTCWKPTLDRFEAVLSRDGATLAQAVKEAGIEK